MSTYPVAQQAALRSENIPSKVAARRGVWRDIILVLAVAAAVRVPCLIISCQDRARLFDNDSASYLSLADELAAGHGFGRPVALVPEGPKHWTPELFRTPGYPAVLAAGQWLTGDAVLAGIVLQNVLGLALCAGMVLVGRRIFGRPAGLLLGLLAAVDLQAVALADHVLTDFPFAVLVFAAVVLAGRLLDRPSLAMAAALAGLLGAAAWVRPTGIGLPIVLGACLLAAALKRKNVRLAMAAMAVAILGSGLIGAWIVRNGVVCGQYALTSVARFNYVSIFGAHTLEYAEGIPHGVAVGRLCDRIGRGAREILHQPLSRQEDRLLHTVVNEVIERYPGAFLWVSAKRMANLWFGPDKLILRTVGAPEVGFGILRASDGTPVPWSVWLLLGFSTLWLLGVYALVLRTLLLRLRGRHFAPLVWIALVTAIYLLLVSSGPLGDPRMRAPAVAPLLLAAAAGLSRRPSGRDEIGPATIQHPLIQMPLTSKTSGT